MIIYTDGSCLSNGNPDAIGGYGIVQLMNTNKLLIVLPKAK